MLTEDGILAYSRRKNVLKFRLKDKFGILTLDPMCGVFPINLEHTEPNFTDQWSIELCTFFQ